MGEVAARSVGGGKGRMGWICGRAGRYRPMSVYCVGSVGSSKGLFFLLISSDSHSMIPREMERPAPGKARKLYGCYGMSSGLMRWQPGMQGDLVKGKESFGEEQGSRIGNFFHTLLSLLAS